MGRSRIESPTSQVEVRDAKRATEDAILEAEGVDAAQAYRVLTPHAWSLPAEMPALLGAYDAAMKKRTRENAIAKADVAFNARIVNAREKAASELVSKVRALAVAIRRHRLGIAD